MFKLWMFALFILSLLDGFDRWFARTAVRIGIHGAFPDRPIVWGIIKDVPLDGMPPRDIRFLIVKLPIRTWGFIPGNFEWKEGLRQHRLQWIERGWSNNPYLGWHIEPPLPP